MTEPVLHPDRPSLLSILGDAGAPPIQAGLRVDQVAGIDEVGRGALFGPVVAAAVILPSTAIALGLQRSGVTDSKQLTAKRRQCLAAQVKAQALTWGIGWASVREIERLNILQASLLAMGRAVQRLVVSPGLCLVDGNQPIPHLPYPQQTVVKGDQREVAIAAASILAKVWRDTLIERLDRRYPGYDLGANKGYGSRRHRQAIAELGVCRQHRQTFKGCQQLEIF